MNLQVVTEPFKIFNISVFNAADFWELLIRFSFNLIVTLLVVRLIYYPKSRRKDYLNTFLIIGITTFLLCFLLSNVKLQMGFALGLFAIFGIIRYRTITMPIKEMTYMFLVIGISVINALSNKKISYSELLLTNLILVVVSWLLEYVFMVKNESCKSIVYEKINLIKPENQTELLADLETRTGLKIHRVEIGEINFLRDTARINIYYFNSNGNFADDNLNTGGDDD